jgi:hypothetical protein
MVTSLKTFSMPYFLRRKCPPEVRNSNLECLTKGVTNLTL